MKPFRFATGVVTALMLAALSFNVSAAGQPLIEDTHFTNTNNLFASCGDFQILENGAGTISLAALRRPALM